MSMFRTNLCLHSHSTQEIRKSNSSNGVKQHFSCSSSSTARPDIATDTTSDTQTDTKFHVVSHRQWSYHATNKRLPTYEYLFCFTFYTLLDTIWYHAGRQPLQWHSFVRSNSEQIQPTTYYVQRAQKQSKNTDESHTCGYERSPSRRCVAGLLLLRTAGCAT